MSDTLGPFSTAEVEQIVQLVHALEQSRFDFLQLETGDWKLTVSKRGPTGLAATVPSSAAVAATAATAPAPAAAVAPAAATPAVAAATPAPAVGPPATDDGGDDALCIRAPIVGRFYAQPEPGAPPFVTVGALVDENTTVGLIEVMKVFNAVRAGCSGVITAVCVQDAQMVEQDQVLFRLRPAAPGGEAETPREGRTA